jgi:ATP-dependent helicase/nuclease subunit A
MTRPAPTREQAGAIDARDRDVLLAAGAGTGKTRVLAERYCEALGDLDAAGEESPVESILAFTFTERAAGELRERVRDYLQERADAESADPERARRIRTWSSGLSRAWISTIHGFCRKLLAVHPTRIGLDPRFRVLEQAEAERLAADAFEVALERFLASGGREHVDVLAMFRLRGLREAILSVHSELRSQGRDPVLPAAIPTDTGAAMQALRKAAAAALEECAEATGKTAEKHTARMRAAIELAGAEQPTAAAVASLAFKSGAKDFGGSAVDAYHEAVKTAERAVVENESLSRYELVRELLAEFATAYGAAKEDRSGLDFEDLQLEAVRLLEENQDLRERYRERFRHIMVDEFQDTNLSQKRLIDLLHGEENHLFCVGDELQSIYGFRHADVGVFRSLRAALEAPESPGEVLPLSGNFRSTPALIEAVNLLGEALIGDRYTALAPGDDDAEGPDPAAELLLVPTAGGGTSLWRENAAELGLIYEGDNAPGPVRVAEARMLAARLRALHDDEGVAQSDMVVLLRAFTPVAAIEQELRRAGLNPYVVGGRGYWQQQQVDDLRRFLEALANPLDDLGLLGLLASPAGGVSPDALWLIRAAADDGRLWLALRQLFGGMAAADEEAAVRIEAVRESFESEDAGALRDFCVRFGELRDRAPALSLEELIETVIGEFGYDLAVLMREDGDRRTANLRKLMRMARAYEAAEGRDLRGFIDHLDERSGDGSEGEAAVAAEGREVVRIMTVHAAKGLEFPVVAFADAGRGLLVGGFPPVVRVGRAIPGDEEGASANRVGIQMARWGAKRLPIFNYLELAEEAEAADAEEALRLAHVAFTRAEKRLIVCGHVKLSALAKEPKPSTPVAERLTCEWGIALGGELGTEGEASTAIPGAAGRRISLQVARPTAEWRDSVPAREPLADAPLPARLEAPLLRPDPGPPAVMPARLSYTSISLHEECAFRFYAQHALGMPEDEGRPGAEGAGGARARGRAAHVLLEWSARHGWARPGEEEIKTVLEHEGIATETERERIRAWIEAWMASPIKAEIESDCGPVRAEADFALATAAGTVISGQIDLLAERTGGGPFVVDYKTNRLDGSEPGALFEAKYSIQRDIYALAAAGPVGTSATTVFVFLERPEQPVRDEFGPEELAAARERVEAAVAEIEKGEFRASDDPSESLCRGCPAKAGLCPRWQWKDGALEIADALFA